MTDDTIETSNIAPIKTNSLVINSVSAPAEPTTAERLRAFEDDVFGKNANRINGEVERGIGSPYAAMTPRQKAHYEALQQLLAAEKGLADASAALASAEAAHAAAVTAAENATKNLDETE